MQKSNPPLHSNSSATVHIHDSDEESFDITFNQDTKKSKPIEFNNECKSSPHSTPTKSKTPKHSKLLLVTQQQSTSTLPTSTTVMNRASSSTSSQSSLLTNPNGTKLTHSNPKPSPIKSSLPTNTVNLFSKILPNQQLQQRHLQQLTHPISLPSSLQLTSLSPATQQLAIFLIDHLQSQQGHLATLQKDIYGLRDVVWTGGLVLQKQQKQLHTLNTTLSEHEESIQQLQDDLIQQEARLRTEIIYQQQEQALQRHQFNLKQRQTRIDNIFDSIIIIVAMLCTGSTPFSVVNSTLSSLSVSLAHILIRWVFQLHPYTLQPLHPKSSQTNVHVQSTTTTTTPLPHFNPTTQYFGGQPLQSTITPTSSPIAQITNDIYSQQHNQNIPPWNQWSRQQQEQLHPSSSTSTTTMSLQPKAPIVLSQADMYHKRRFRKNIVWSLLRFAQTVYIFLFLRKLFVNLGFIQSPLTEYLRAILPTPLYQFFASFSLSKIKRQLQSPLKLLLGPLYSGITPSQSATSRSTSSQSSSTTTSNNDTTNFNNDSSFELESENEPLSKDEIYHRVFSNLKANPDLIQFNTTHHDQNNNSTNENSHNSITTTSNTSSLESSSTNQQSTTTTPPNFNPISNPTTLTSTALNSILPQWASSYVTPFADKVALALNPFSDPYHIHIHSTNNNDNHNNNPNNLQQQYPYQQPLSTHDTHHNPHRFGYDQTTQQLLRDPSKTHIESTPNLDHSISYNRPTAPSEEDIVYHNASQDNNKNSDTHDKSTNSVPSTQEEEQQQNPIVSTFRGLTKMFDDIFFD